MGAQFSKRRTGGRPSAPVSAAGNFQYMEELSSYEAACRIDSEIQTFDAGLQRRTSRVISNLAVNVELHSLSFDTLKEVVGSLLDMNHDVVHVILECKKDIWNNPELSDLVEDYFDNSLQTLDFCAALEKCLNHARNSQLFVQLALQCFEEEQIEKTLEALRHFKAAGDPFTEEFFQAFQSVYTQQLAMLEKLHLKKSKLDRKLSSVKAWRKVSCIIFASAFAALLICSVVAALVAAPPIAAAVAAASSIPLGSMGKWFDSMWKDCQDAIQAEKELISTIKAGTFVVVSDLDSISFLVNRLEDKISSLLVNAEFSLRDEEALKFGIEEIRKKMVVFMRSVEDLAQQADRCSRDIGRARTVVLQRIIKHPK